MVYGLWSDVTTTCDDHRESFSGKPLNQECIFKITGISKVTLCQKMVCEIYPHNLQKVVQLKGIFHKMKTLRHRKARNLFLLL